MPASSWGPDLAWVVPRVWTVLEEATAAKMNEISTSLTDLDRRTSPSGATVATGESTGATVYSDLTTAGPAVVVTIGAVTKALVAIYSALSNTTSNFALMSVGVTGASTIVAADSESLQYNGTSNIRMGATYLKNLTAAGSTTFTAKYRCTSPTADFNGRHILATPLSA